MRKALWMALVFVGLGMGVAGVLVPLLPAFPFLALAAFSFSRASDRLHRWFLGTGLYRDYVAGFTSGRGITRKAKIRAMLAVTAAMGAGFLLLRGIPWARAVLAVIWAGHVLLFLFGIRTLPDKTESFSAGCPLPASAVSRFPRRRGRSRTG